MRPGNVCTPMGLITRQEMEFFRINVKTDPLFKFGFKKKPRVVNETHDRLVIMFHKRYLLKKYYGLPTHNLSKPVKFSDIEDTESKIMDDLNDLETPNYMELVARYLQITDYGAGYTLYLAMERLNKHKQTAATLQSCSVCYKLKLRNQFAVMNCQSGSGHMVCLTCLAGMETQVCCGPLCCPLCNLEVNGYIKIAGLN